MKHKLKPDDKTISQFRHDNADALKNVFRDYVRLCVRAELYGSELVAIEGSKSKAVNSKERNFNAAKLKERMAWLAARRNKYADMAEELKTSGETQVSPTDPESRRMLTHGSTDICYNVQMSPKGDRGDF